jgi:hypothetical protein
MIRWELHTRLPDIGRISIQGRERDGTLYFDHPHEEGSIVLQVSEDRAHEIAAMSRHEQSKMNLYLEKKVIHVGREFHREPLLQMSCLWCRGDCVWIDSDFVLHSIPWCSEWRKTN